MLNHRFISGLQTATRTTRKNDVTVNGEKGHSSMSSYGSFAFLVADASDCGGAGLSQSGLSYLCAGLDKSHLLPSDS